ncbi:unnamed protein product [Sphagnum jensenii]|uniref:AMP-binding enzyme C-terminal domain-containing protein n=1 Tax=Sphagnum jensenii TaxID=128206 RepID=A0ABP0VF36_9BRYO
MSIGPDIVIVDDSMVREVPVGIIGNILIRGSPCFSLTGWFNTGDTGSVNNDGYLFISGRSKEIINRGGETISPFEIEEAVIQHPLVKETLAFSAPHRTFQETVGVVIVTKAGHPRVDLPSLHKYLENKLHRSKWPQVTEAMKQLS